MALTQIDAYEVMYSSNTFVPRIMLMSGGQDIGQLIFMPNGSALPVDGISGNQVNLYYHLDDFQNVINLLRDEEPPIYLLYSGSGGGFENGIVTTEEVMSSVSA